MPKGLLNPKNAVESTGGFREGLIRVDTAEFKVHQGQPPKNSSRPAPAPVMALVWGVTRLDEDDQTPLHDDDGNPQTEQLIFSLGGKSLGQVHPGKADSADDEESEDLGAEVNASGPTVFLINPEFHLNSKSGCNQLMESLKKAGFKEEYLDRVWAPDFVGGVFHMKTLISDQIMTGDDGKERPINYKIVDKIVRAGYEKKKKQGNGEVVPVSQGKSSSKNAEAETVAGKLLEKLSETLDGQKLTRKALSTRVVGVLNSDGIPAKLHVPVLEFIKNNDWLKKNAGTYDITYDEAENTVVFGQLAE